MKPQLHADGLYLALGGGAARALAHLGALKSLQRHGVPIAGVCGTSMGALIGAAYALAPNAEQVAKDFVDYVQSPHFQSKRYAFIRAFHRQTVASERTLRQKLTHGLLVGRSLATGAILSFEDYRSEINALLPDKSFKDLKLPFMAVSVDLVRFVETVFYKGLLRPAAMASAAIPGAFPAVRNGETVYVDGGWMNKVPVEPLLHLGAEKVLAIDVSDPAPTDLNTRRGFALNNRANTAAKIRLRQLQMQRASIVWAPPIDDLHWAEFMAIERAIDAGERYADERIDDVKRLLDQPPRKSPLERMTERLCGWLHPPRSFPPSFELREIWAATSAEDLPL